MASWLDAPELCRLDVVCRLLRVVNALPKGPWRAAGELAFFGMELDAHGGFAPFDEGDGAPVRSRPAPQHSVSWKRRCELFRKQVPTFSAPFKGSEIAVVEHPDEVAYCRCRLRTDLLAEDPGVGVYVEVEVLRNADNLSLAVVDFEGGGCSSVTFSPETGAVLRERKVREAPRAIEGTYIHLLSAAPAGRRFEGTMGLYLRDGHLAFFRRWSGASTQAAAEAAAAAGVAAAAAGAAGVVVASATAAVGASSSTDRGAAGIAGDGVPTREADVAAGDSAAAPQHAAAAAAAPGHDAAEPSWETTGFCTDLRWAQGPRLSICLAFRDDGPYRVRLARVSRVPPAPPEQASDAYQEDKWSLLYGDDDHPLAI